MVALGTQQEWLLIKTKSIHQNLTGDEKHIFELGKFLYVLSVGWNDETALEMAENVYTDVAMPFITIAR